MEELLEIKQLLQTGEVADALALVEDLEEMGRKAIARNIRTYAKVLLLHLLKQQIERRSTKSWEASIRNAVREIRDINARPKGKGCYLDDEDLKEAIASAFDSALDQASIEVFEGTLSVGEIEQQISQQELISQAFSVVRGDRP